TLLLAADSATGSVTLQGSWLEWPLAGWIYFAAWVAALGFEGRGMWHEARSAALRRALSCAALGLALVTLCVALSAPRLILAFAAALTIGGVIASVWLWGRGTSWHSGVAPRVGIWGFILGLACRSAGVLAVVASICYFVVALSIWPPRAKLNAALERRLQVGEVAWMHEQLSLQRQTTRQRREIIK
ncbi:MAG: hypothetical protein KY445_15490, partial [Armatimonadetes bacterium]|nr:hypothetical protein [Armatimonadota bacterium]